MNVGPLLPAKYFLTIGIGESDVQTDRNSNEQTIYEANSYDAATCSAGIENVNVVEYSSLLPTSAVITNKPSYIPWGSILGVIRAESSGCQGELLTAAIFIIEIRYEKKMASVGYVVVEYAGHLPFLKADRVVMEEILGMLQRRKFGTSHQLAMELRMNNDWKMLRNQFYSLDHSPYQFQIVHNVGTSFVCTKKHGTALAMCCIYEWVAQSPLH
jgi:pyruvoyl-dependent arginine decarboxylase (PvlArgDC)